MTLTATGRSLRWIALLGGLLLLSSALIPAPAAADDSTTADGPANVTMQFQTIICDSYGGVRGNTPGTPDDTQRGEEAFGSLIDRSPGRDLPVVALTQAPANCSFAPDRGDFAFAFGSEIGDQPLTLSSDVHAAFDARTGTVRTTARDLLASGESGNDGATRLLTLNQRLAVAVIVPDDHAFGTLSCFDDARNDDNLEYLEGVGTKAPGVVTCIAWLVGDLPEVPEQPTPPSSSPQRPRTEVLGEQSVSIEQDGQTVTVAGPAGGDIDLSFPDADDDTARIVADACQALIDEHPDRPARLSPNTFTVLPSGFQAGDELTITSTVPGDYVTQPADYATVGTGDFQTGPAPDDVNFVTEEQIRSRLIAIRDNRGLAPDPASDGIWIDRIIAGTHTIGDARTAISAKGAYEAAGAFQLCFVGEKEDHGSVTGLPSLPGTDLFGPVLLDDCSQQITAPCVESRDKVGNDVIVVATIPAEDPWMR